MYDASLDRCQYQRLRFSLLTLLETSGQVNLQVYLDARQIPTLGVGFNLYRLPVMQQLLWQLSLPLAQIPQVSFGMLQHMNRTVISSYRELADIRANLNARLNQLTEGRLTELALPNAAAVEAMFNRLIVVTEAELDRRLQGSRLPYSWERLALLSLLYDSGLLLGPNLTRAVRTGARERAWYEIRCCSNSGRSRCAAIANRRYIEAELWRADHPLQWTWLTPAQRQRMQAYEHQYSPAGALDRYQSWYAQAHADS